MKLKISNTNILISIVVLIFSFSDYFRKSVSALLNLNTIPYISTMNILLILIILYGIITNKITIPKNNSMLLIIIFSLMCLISIILGYSQIEYLVIYPFNLLLPLVLMYCNYRYINWTNVCKKSIAFLNIFTYSILIFGIVDYISNGYINEWLSKWFYMNSLVENLNSVYNTTYRLITPWGPSLFNSFTFLIFLVINTTNIIKGNKKSNKVFFYYSVTLIGVILTGSKAALICALVYILVSNIQGNKKFFKILIVLFMLVLIMNSSFFKDNIGSRFIHQYNSGDLSSGRNYIISFIFNGEVEVPRLFLGKGSGYSRILARSLSGYGVATNFEYPLIMLAYDYGIFATIIYMILFFLIPIGKFCKSKDYISAFGYFIIVIFLNTFNGIADLNYDFNYKLLAVYILLKSINSKEK